MLNVYTTHLKEMEDAQVIGSTRVTCSTWHKDERRPAMNVFILVRSEQVGVAGYKLLDSNATRIDPAVPRNKTVVVMLAFLIKSCDVMRFNKSNKITLGIAWHMLHDVVTIAMLERGHAIQQYPGSINNPFAK
jgi:hypothetical protein